MGQQPGGIPKTRRTAPPKSSTTPAGLYFHGCRASNADKIVYMRVHFERLGGFAGIKLRLSLDVDSLPTEDASRLKKLLEKSNFYHLPGKLSSAGAQPDRFTYRLTVESDLGTRSVEAAESAVPSEMRPLLEWLTRNCQHK